MAVGHWDARAARRIFKELRTIDACLPEGYTLEPMKPCDLSSWRGTFPGPEGTPYEGGTFEVNIQLPGGYGFAPPPRLTFLTKVWHPNVSSTNGSTCLFTRDWRPVLTLPKMLLCAQALLSYTDPGDSHDTVVAAQYMDRRDLFERTARDWTNRFANKIARGAFVGDHHEPARYFAPDGWGEGHDGESTNEAAAIHEIISKVVSRKSADARRHLREVLMHIDDHTQSLPECAYLNITRGLKLAYDAWQSDIHDSS